MNSHSAYLDCARHRSNTQLCPHVCTNTHTHSQCVFTHTCKQLLPTPAATRVPTCAHVHAHTAPRRPAAARPAPPPPPALQPEPWAGTRHPGRNMTRATRGRLPPRPVGASRLAMQPSGQGALVGTCPSLDRAMSHGRRPPLEPQGTGCRGPGRPQSGAQLSWGHSLPQGPGGSHTPPSKPLPHPHPQTQTQTRGLWELPSHLHPGQRPQPEGVGLAPGTRWGGVVRGCVWPPGTWWVVGGGL